MNPTSRAGGQPPRFAPAPALLLALVLLAPGCGSFDVYLAGTSHRTPPAAALRFDPAGRPYVGEERVFLPLAQEDLRYGVVFVDATPLPPAWRPAHAPRGGVLVGAVDRASPLAIAGLQSFDLVESVAGRPVLSPSEAVEPLRTAAEVELAVVGFDGQRRTVRARAVEQVQEVGGFHVPFLVESRSSSSGSAFGLGPLDVLFNYRAAALLVAPPPDHQQTEQRYAELMRYRAALEQDAGRPTPQVSEEQRAEILAAMQAAATELGAALEQRYLETAPRYVERTEWGLLMNLFYYQGERDPLSGAERGRFRLFWLLSFGDDLEEAGT